MIRLFALAGSIAVSGCAFEGVMIEPPAAPPTTLPRTFGRGREIALASVFVDRRAQPHRCGMQKNGYNMDTADVTCALEPARWVPDALARGLASAGFVVTAAPSPSPAAVRVEGDVLQFFVEPVVGAFTFSPEADISVRLRVSTADGLYAERTFYVKAAETAMTGLEENFQAAAERATSRAVHALVVAIAELLDRHPPATVPTSVVRVAEVAR